jgi:diacylglycerol kinase family enzyme
MAMTHEGRGLVIANPVSTGFKSDAVQRQIDGLMRYYGTDFDLQLTCADPTENQAMIRGSVKDGDLIYPVGGDKTLGDVSDVLADDEFQNRNILLAPLCGGNKNDFARSIGNTLDVPMVDIGRFGHMGAVHLIEGTITTPGGVAQTQRGINVVSLGASADIAHGGNDPEYRRIAREEGIVKQALSDWGVVKGALGRLEAFGIELDTRPGKILPRYEFTLTNSTRAGGRAKPPTEAGDPRICRIELDSKNPLRVARLILGLMAGKCPKSETEFMLPPEEYAFTLQELDHDPEETPHGVMAEFDGDVILDDAGEPIWYGPGTHFSFKHSKNPVQVKQMRPFIRQPLEPMDVS